MKQFAASPVLRRIGKRAFRRFPVTVTQSSLSGEAEVTVTILASSAAEAANAVRDEFLPHLDRPTTFTAFGPQGGRTVRWAGWDTLAAQALLVSQPTRNLNLNLEG